MADTKRILDVNGPGSNGLRGGIKTYSAKTATGQWLEEYGGPGDYKRGFTIDEFETEGQHAQSGALGKAIGHFGAAIMEPKPVELPVNALIGTDAEVKWETNTHAAHRNLFNEQKGTDHFDPLEPTMPRDRLEDYRKSWTVDSETNRAIRFQTESRIAANQAVGKKFFQKRTLRFLPGTPKSLEDYRCRLIERFGILGIGHLKLQIGNTGKSCAAFKSNIRALGVELKPYEFSQVLAFITPSSTHLTDEEVQKFVSITRGHVEGYEPTVARKIFQQIAGSNGISGDTSVTLEMLQNSINGADHPELQDGMALIFPAYSTSGDTEGTLTADGFVELLHDIFVSIPDSFDDFLASVWRKK